MMFLPHFIKGRAHVIFNMALLPRWVSCSVWA